MARCVLCNYSKRNSHNPTGPNHRKSHWKWRSCVVDGKEHGIHATFRQGIADHRQLCKWIHHFRHRPATQRQRSIGEDICTASFRETSCSQSRRSCCDVCEKRLDMTMKPPQHIMSLARTPHKPYLAGSVICICFFLLELTAWANISLWSWLYLTPYCIALLLLAWFPMPACTAILATHIACALIPAICDGPSTLYGTWLACGILAFEVRRFAFAIAGLMLCALVLPLGYWTGGIDYNSSIPVLACSYIGAFFVGFAIRWKIQTEQRKTDLAIAQEQVRRQQERLRETHILHDSIAGSMTYAILLCRKEESMKSNDALAQIEQVLTQALHELRTQIINPMANDLETGNETDKRNDLDLFQQRIESQCDRLRTLGFTGMPIIRGDLNAIDKAELPLLQTACTEILNNIAKHGKPGPFAFILSVEAGSAESGEAHIFASNPYSAAMDSESKNHYGIALIQKFVRQHNGTMTIHSENEEWSLSLTIPLTHQANQTSRQRYSR